MNGYDKFTLILITIILLFGCVVYGMDIYQEAHTSKYYIEFQNKRYELKEVKWWLVKMI